MCVHNMRWYALHEQLACSESVSCSNVLQLLGNLRGEEETPNQDELTDLYQHMI